MNSQLEEGRLAPLTEKMQNREKSWQRWKFSSKSPVIINLSELTAQPPVHHTKGLIHCTLSRILDVLNGERTLCLAFGWTSSIFLREVSTSIISASPVISLCHHEFPASIVEWTISNRCWFITMPCLQKMFIVLDDLFLYDYRVENIDFRSSQSARGRIINISRSVVLSTCPAGMQDARGCDLAGILSGALYRMSALTQDVLLLR